MRWIQSWDVPSESSSRTYKVSRSDTGDFGCSCPSWRFRSKGAGGKRSDCKHIRKLRTTLVTAPPVRRASESQGGATVTAAPRKRLGDVLARPAPKAADTAVAMGALDELLGSYMKGDPR